jgi:hypothetical protein
MESSIAVFLSRWSACELPPTEVARASAVRRWRFVGVFGVSVKDVTRRENIGPVDFWHGSISQRSLQDAPIFRLLLKVAVKGTHQCDFINFCGGVTPQLLTTMGARGVRQTQGSQNKTLLAPLGRAILWLRHVVYIDCTRTGSLLQ